MIAAMMKSNYLTATLASLGPLAVAGLQVQSSTIFDAPAIAANAAATNKKIYMDCGSGEFTLYEFSVSAGKLQQKVLEKQKYDKLAKDNGNVKDGKEVFNKCTERGFPKKTAFVSLLCEANKRFQETTATNMADAIIKFLKEAGYPRGAAVHIDPGFTGSNREVFRPSSERANQALMHDANQLFSKVKSMIQTMDDNYHVNFTHVEANSVILATNEALYENDSITFLFDNVDQKWLYDNVLMALNVVANPAETWIKAILYDMDYKLRKTPLGDYSFSEWFGFMYNQIDHQALFCAAEHHVATFGQGCVQPKDIAEVIVSRPEFLVPFAGKVLFAGHLARGSGSFQGSRKDRQTGHVNGFSAVLEDDINFSDDFKQAKSGLFMGISGTVHGATSINQMGYMVPRFNDQTNKIEQVPLDAGIQLSNGVKHMVWSYSDLMQQCEFAASYLDARNSQTVKDIKQAAGHMIVPEEGASIVIFLRDWILDSGVKANAGWCLGKYLADTGNFGANDPRGTSTRKITTKLGQ